MAASDTVEYIEHDGVNYEFTNLKENTEYIIYGYVEDINGIKSNVYSTSITTNEYVLPSVSEVTHSVTLNSITLNVNAENGDGNVVTYMYSKDNGVSWETSASNTYTFNYLNDTTEYKIKVKVVDSNGRESTEYYEAISTETYILPTVANVDYTTAYNSITLTPTGANGTGTISKYVYSINNGTYQDSNVFSGLTENTTYTVSVKAIDNNNRESNPYIVQIKTDTYKVPTITNVTTSSTTNSITINVSASNGDGPITKYMYSRDNGSNWYESTSNSYTFDNLTSNTTFYVQVKVVDNNGRESAVSNTTVQTQYLNPSVNSVSASNITQNSITLTVNATPGSNSIATYYYSNNNGSSYVSSSSNTYTFNNLTPGTTYNFRVYVVDSGSVRSNEATASATTEDNSLAAYIKSLYTSQGSNGLYYHTSSLANSAGDNSYRYSGANPNNYVCFGSTASTCPNDNLYRIIGVFNNQVKLIKADCTTTAITGTGGAYYTQMSNLEQYDLVYGSYNYQGWLSFSSVAIYYWNPSGSNTWNNSTLNTINLNNTFLNNFNSTWQNKIATHTWKVGGVTRDTVVDIPKTVYNYEVGSNSNSTTYNAKIGLMYISDYGFAASRSLWTQDMSGYSSTRSNNWMRIGLSNWTITPGTSVSGSKFLVDQLGNVQNDYTYINGNTGYETDINFEYAAIRPAFYLNSDVEYVSGTGTQSNPYRIS